MFGSQPCLKMGEGTEPVKYLYDEGKGETGEMEYFYCSAPSSPDAAQEEKDDPEKMNQNNSVCENLV